MTEIVYVMNPWSGIYHATTRKDVTPEKLAAMAALMEDDIREELHREFLNDSFAFWAAYVNRVGSEEAGKIWFS